MTRDPETSRRAILKRLAHAGGLGAVASAVTWYFHDRDVARQPVVSPLPARRAPGPGPKLATVSGPSPAANVRAALAALGGMERFVRPRDLVLIKPNAGWDRLPEQAANTNPEIVAELVRLARGAGAREVIVADIPCNDAKRSFSRSGIERAAQDAGARAAYPPLPFVPIDLGGPFLGQWDVFEPLLRADCVINVPIVKSHGLARATIGMKNWFGILGKRRLLLHQRLDDAIVDLALAVKPSLTVVDASRVLMRNGPQGGSLADVKQVDALAAGTDPVALDAWGAQWLGLRPDEVPYLRLAEARRLGVVDWKSLSPREARVG